MFNSAVATEILQSLFKALAVTIAKFVLEAAISKSVWFLFL